MDFSPLAVSLRTAVTATLIVALTGIPAAWMVRVLPLRSRTVADSLLSLPLVLPPTVVGLLLLLLLGKNGPMGFLTGNRDGSLLFTRFATTAAAAVVSFPLTYRTARGAFEQLDPGILQSARTLGASEYRIFFHIACPLAAPGIASGLALGFARALGEFGATLMVSGSIPGRTRTIPVAIFQATERGDMSQAIFWSMAIFLVSLLAMWVVNLRTPFVSSKRTRRTQRNSENGSTSI